MKWIQRSFLSIRRNPIRSALVLGSVLLIGTLLSFGLFTRQAIVQAELRLREQIPPTVALEWQGSELADEFLTVGMIGELGNLPYIRTYDIRSRFGLNRRDLIPAIPAFDTFNVVYEDEYMAEDIQGIIDGVMLVFGLDDHVIAIGTNTPHPLDLEAGLIELVDGRFMYESELLNASEVVVISQAFADANDLVLGDTLFLEYNVIDHYTPRIEEEVTIVDGLMLVAGEVIYQQVLELEIIGLFEINRELVIIDTFNRAIDVTQLYNQIYLPYSLQEQLHSESIDYWIHLITLYEEFIGESLPRFVPTNEIPMYIEASFLLYDSRDFNSFFDVVEGILPSGWTVVDTSGVFGSALMAMDNVLWISTLIFWGSILATVVVISLISLLFLQDRKQEIGTYLALGEKKRSIFGQLLTEVMGIACFGLMIALLLGNVISQSVSTNMLRQEIEIQLAEDIRYVPHADLNLFAPQPLTLEETIELYEVSLGTDGVLLFFAVGGTTILLSSGIQISRVVKLEPKDVLIA